MDNNTSKEVVPQEEQSNSIVEVAAPIKDIVKQVKMFGELKAQLLGESDYQKISNKNFIKKAGWRKLALAFNISDEILKEERKEYETSNGVAYFSWEVTAKAIAPNGRFSVSTASCSSNERTFSHVDHDVRSTAGTRAKNRAISDLIGGGEVSAEEMMSGGNGPVEREAPIHREAIVRDAPIMVDQTKIAHIMILLKKLGKEDAWFKQWIQKQSKKDLTMKEALGYIKIMEDKLVEITAKEAGEFGNCSHCGVGVGQGHAEGCELAATQ